MTLETVPAITLFPFFNSRIRDRLMRLGLLFLVSYFLWFVAHTSLAQEERETVFRGSIQPLIGKYCFDCHNADESEADLNLTPFKSAQSILEGRQTWLKVLAKIQTEKMPPEEGDQPSKDERQQLVAWLDDVLNNIDCDLLRNPGRPTIRRLNRTEYRNTVRDLLGVDYIPAIDFPADDVGYGFDNIGDVLSLPPILMEKYLKAAEEISQTAIVTEGIYGPLSQVVNGSDMQSARGGGPVGRTDRILTTTAEMTTEIEFPLDGEYEFRATGYGDQAGPEDVKMSFRIDGKDEKTVEVKATRSRPIPYTARIKMTAGKRKVGLAFLNDYYNPKAEKPGDRDRNLIVKQLEVSGPVDYEPPDLPATHRLIFIAKPDDKTSRRDAAKKVLLRLTSRAYRRPATDEEIERLLKLTDFVEEKGDSFYVGVQMALQAILVSPHFLFKVELPPESPGSDETYTLDDYQLATSISYFLWRSMPDDELFGHAWNGTLRKDDNLIGQIVRMVNHPRSRTLVDNFAEQWFQLRNLETMQPDARQFPNYNEGLLAAMRMETLLFFNSLLRTNSSVLELFSADYTFLNEQLAQHYGISGVSGNEFRRVSLRGTNRGGLLTQASILAITSNPTRTSPVKRGKWILENLLNTPPPPPAPDVMQLEDQKELTGTLRQRMEQHRRDPGCASCHQQMDPLGFALENFDAIGRWRTHDGEGQIDATGVLVSGEQFSGAIELQQILLKKKKGEFVRCLTEKMLTYALGRGLEYYDKCAVDKIVEALEKDNYRFGTLIIEIVKSEPFQRRKLELN